MVIISKKRIILLTSMLCAVIFICNLIVNKTDTNINTVQTVALPVTNKVIVLDARPWKAR